MQRLTLRVMTWRRMGVLVPRELKLLVEECWAPDFERRPSFPALIKRLEAILLSLPASPPPPAGAAPNSSQGACCCVQ